MHSLIHANYHCHTKRCGHACGSEEEYVISAINSKLELLGFSDHAPFSDDRGVAMPFCELEDYIATISQLKEKYKEKIKILTGFEIEYFEDSDLYYQSLLERDDFDYLIMGQHFFFDKNNEKINSFEFDDTEELFNYVKLIIKGMKTGFFSYLAHPDVVFINDLAWDKNAQKAMEMLVNEAQKNKWIFEFNANGLRRGKKEFSEGIRYPYPYKKLWDIVREANLRVIIGSDCHNPKFTNDSYVAEAKQLAESWQLNLIERLPL